MNRGVTTALRHTIYADFNKVFSFTLPAKDLEALAKASERYLLNTVERGFATLDFISRFASRPPRTFERSAVCDGGGV